MSEAFRKDLKHLTWDQVYGRQEVRAPLVAEWMDALGLKPGDCVLDVGCGPGFVSLLLAERVGRDGMVVALDRAAEALAYLARLQEERGVTQIRRVEGDAAADDLAGILAAAAFGRPIGAALVTMVLHHAKDAPAILRNVAELLPPGAPVVVAEFHPDSPGEHGPPPELRIAADTIRRWCESAGLDVVDCRRQSPEHYMLLARRRSAQPVPGR